MNLRLSKVLTNECPWIFLGATANEKPVYQFN